MNAIMNEKGRQTKLLAAFAVLAMVVCAFAVAVPSSIDAATPEVDLDSAVNGYDSSSEKYEDLAGFNGSSLEITNDGLGNKDLAYTIKETGENKKTITLTGTLNKQNIAYDGTEWSGTNLSDSAKGFYSSFVQYSIGNETNKASPWAFVMTINGSDKCIYYVYEGKTFQPFTVDDVEYTVDVSELVLSDETVAAEIIVLNNGTTVSLPEGVTATVTETDAGATISVSGTPVAANSTEAVEGSSNFVNTFHGKDTSTVPWGYAFAQINGLDTIIDGASNVSIKQTNSALGWYDGNGDLSVSGIEKVGNTYVKEKATYDSSNTEYYAFLIPQNGGEVKIEIGTATPVTYTFNFDIEAADFVVSDVTSNVDAINDAMQNGSTVIVDSDSAVTITEELIVTESGIQFTGTGAVTGTMTLRAAGAEAAETDATIELQSYNGTVTFSYGSAEITQGDIDKGTIIIKDETDILIQGVTVGEAGATIEVPAGATVRIGSDVIINGTLTITGTGATEENPVKVRLSNNNTLTINEKGILDLGAYVEMDAKGTVTGTGSINVTENASLTFSAGMVTVTGTGEIINNAVSGGTINLTDGTVVDARSSVDGSATQEVVVSGEVTVVAGGSIIINGKLTIEDGAELILEQGATLLINSTGKVDLKGTITVQADADNTETIFTYNGSDMTVSGTLDLEGAEAASINGKMTVSGIVNIGEGSSATLSDDSTIAAGGNLNVEGTVSGTVVNSGTITIDSEDSIIGFTVYMMDASTLNLDNAVGTVTVDDSKMQYKVSGVDTTIKNVSSATFENVSGIVVTDSLTIKNEDLNNDGVNERNGYGNLSISGNADVATNADDSLELATITVVSGTVNVAEGSTLSMTDKTKITVESGTADKPTQLIVAGTLTNTNKDAKQNIVAESNAEITVTGLIQSVYKIEGTVNAAMYEDDTVDPEIYNYTTLEKAIAAGATDIDVLGEITVEEDVTIPVGTTVTSTGAIVNIDEEATLTVAADDTGSAKFKNGTVNVDGTMVVQNLRKSSVVEDDVISDVATKDGVSATYTNIYNALASAQDGDTVTITKGGNGIVELDKNLTIPAGVTLEIPAEKTVKALAGITVTVDGTLSFEDGDYEMDGKTGNKDAAKTIVNGLLETDSTADYRIKDADNNQIVGAYFMVDGLECIAPVAYAASVINDVESDVEIVGDVTAQDVEFNYTADEGFKIVVNSESSLTAGTITLSGIDFQFVGEVDATIAVANGSFTLKDVVGGTTPVVITDETVFDENNNESHIATLSGTVANAKDDKGDLNGKITANGTVAVGVSTIGVDFEVAEGATATVNGDNADFNDKVMVNGNLVIDATNVTLDGTTVVYGTVSVEEDASATAKKIFIGFDQDADNEDLVINIGSGTVSGVTLGTDGVAIVTPESAFTPVQTQTESIVSTEYYIEDALWMTAYAAYDDVAIPNLNAQIDNAKFNAWENADGQGILDADEKVNKNIGSTGFEQVYADIKYDIYNVFVTADEGIGTVYIDGKVMTKISNTFVLMDGIELVQFEAGEHEISYVLKNNFSGTVKMYVNGTEDSDMTFTLEGNLEPNKTTVDYTINLVGVEPTAPVTPSGDSGSNDGMGLTDYLLIVLVVLIVIMAVIVAIRLMRS